LEPTRDEAADRLRGGPLKRTIAAILAADVAGYSRLVAEDEEDTLRRLAGHRAVFREQVSRFGGRVFNTAGDAILAEFPSAVEGLRAGIAIQEILRERNREHPPGRRICFRMGMTIGDVVEQDGDLLGDGVNIAARLEGIAEPGGICIARSVHEAIDNKVAVTFRDIGPQKLKNIPRPVHAFRAVLPADPADGSGQDGRRGGRLRRLAPVIALLLLALGLGAGLWYGLPGLRRDPAIAALRANPDRDDILTVSVARASQACFADEASFSGTIVPRREIEIRPDAEGLRVAQVLTQPMAEVAAGQVLAQLSRAGEPEGAVVALRAPVPGIVGRSNALVGAPASARGAPLFQLVAYGEFELEAEISLDTLERLAPGQAVTLRPLGLPELQGRIRLVSPQVDPATQLGSVRVLLRNAAGLRQGLFARGTVSLGERCGVAIPQSAILRGPEGTSVYVVSESRVEGRPVTPGLLSGNLVEVREGLAVDDTVILRAGPFLREGDVVRPALVATARSAD
jgi:class 3 adenylate cyclase/multidrug efflux pump subunit AcrA (membrane-fusion protein)